jgi:hypothetical protein
MKKGTCKHFRGIQHDTCSDNRDWRAITGGDMIGVAQRMPCIKRNPDQMICDFYAEPTEKEIEEDNAWIDKAIQNIKIAMPLISKIKEEYPDGGIGTKDCPVCGDKFHFSVAACNGHVHGKCETDDCLSFME